MLLTFCPRWITYEHISHGPSHLDSGCAMLAHLRHNEKQPKDSPDHWCDHGACAARSRTRSRSTLSVRARARSARTGTSGPAEHISHGPSHLDSGCAMLAHLRHNEKQPKDSPDHWCDHGACAARSRTRSRSTLSVRARARSARTGTSGPAATTTWLEQLRHGLSNEEDEYKESFLCEVPIKDISPEERSPRDAAPAALRVAVAEPQPQGAPRREHDRAASSCTRIIKKKALKGMAKNSILIPRGAELAAAGPDGGGHRVLLHRCRANCDLRSSIAMARCITRRSSVARRAIYCLQMGTYPPDQLDHWNQSAGAHLIWTNEAS
ncbi:hypothetical protein GLOTRDRAFT_96203 [Gloeophyllum trabeum ATCC 11539]|uniref:Uncharacterized protein n=1 Tax=Gloeophyllum trabeum (strain ATCC 11539 / FP-39264 / Madison 617) TaxID=670483 RepID=S7PV74_GLOTA|nr:uncharacterized protein GLOTRDRAFT_96203 [Gloeophyllum trabeum ATCC 11539]EPQ51433.1 hypothetical protein GLOTRDRAFT_96203 [Gloeophyllum trabeum ATCC 11539]